MTLFGAQKEYEQADSPLGRLTKESGFFNLHHFDVIQIPRPAPDGFGNRVNLRFLDNPCLCSRYDALRSPAGKRPPFQDEACGQKRAVGRLLARDDIAGNDVCRVWVGIAEEEGERNDGPGIAVARSACAKA